jgi:hypothetical protein
LVRRLTLIAIGLSALLWTAAAHTPVAPDRAVAIAGGGARAMAGETPEPSDSDRQWRARRLTVAAVTESVWKSSPVHAALASSVAPRTLDLSLAPSSPDPPARSALPYLRHTPLLI